VSYKAVRWLGGLYIIHVSYKAVRWLGGLYMIHCFTASLTNCTVNNITQVSDQYLSIITCTGIL